MADVNDDSSQSSNNPKNTASLVGRAVHQTETRAKQSVVERGAVHFNEADKDDQSDGILREQKAKLRKSSRPDNPASNGPVKESTNELEEVRQQLRHVQLDSQLHNGYVNGHHHTDTNGNNYPVFVENGIYENGEISPKRNGYQSHGDSSSVSSSSYYGDIEDVAKEMYDLANNVEDARL